jgi:hypothetical protein
MSVSLDTLEAALFTRLRMLAANGAALSTSVPFRTVARWAGEVTAEDIVDGHLGVCPSALFAHEGSQTVSASDLQYVETLGHDVEVVERHLFRVYVTVQDTRGDTATVKGGTGTPGILACTQAVAEALAGFRVSGLFRGGVVALIERVPWRIERGESRTDLVRFAALSSLPASAVGATLPGNTMSRVDASVRHEEADVDALPITLASNRTTT